VTRPRAGAIIVGVGQRFAGDDGVGPAVIDRLRASPLPPHVALREVREPSALLPMLGQPGARLVIVDAVLADPPGEISALDPAAIARAAPTFVLHHGLSVGQALALAAAMRAGAAATAAPEVRVVAVSIARPVRGAPGLSPSVAASVDGAADLAVALALAR
jgi:hydrogenase maturation protease